MIEVNTTLLIFSLIGVAILIFIFARRPRHNCAKYLGVKKHHTIELSDFHPEHFDDINYHLYCELCNKDYDITFAHIRNGVKNFLNSDIE